MNTELGDVFTVDQDVTLAELQEPEQGREQCALSGPGTANDEHGGARLYTDIDVLENRPLGTTGVGSLNTAEDDLTAGWPGAFSRVSGQVRGSVLGEFLRVLLKTLDGAHLGLDCGGGLDQRVHDVGEDSRTSQSGAVLGRAHNLCGFSEHSDGEDN